MCLVKNLSLYCHLHIFISNSQPLVYSYFYLKNRVMIGIPSFSTSSIFKEKYIFRSHCMKLKAGFFKFFRFEERFGKAPFS